jgi:hypothetical protein
MSIDMVIKVAVMILGFIAFLGLLAWVFTGGIESKSLTGVIVDITNSDSDEGSIIHFADGAMLKAYNRFPNAETLLTRVEGEECIVKYNRVKGGLLIKERIYLEELWKAK